MAVSKNEIIELYISYYDRAPDSGGLDYWMAHSDMTQLEMARLFMDQDETRAKYPESLSDADFINEIYLNVFNRPAEAGGIAYWLDAFNNGFTREDMIVTVLEGAQGNDKAVVDNKVEVGADFADAGLNDYGNAVDIMDTITADDATVVAAKAQIDIWQGTADTLNYTLEEDNLQGTSGDDTFSGILDDRFAAEDRSTFETRDYADGRGGYDTVDVRNIGTNAVNMIVDMDNIENFVIEESGAANATYHMQNVTGLQRIEMNDFNGVTDSFTDLANIVDVAMVSDSAVTILNVNYQGAVVAGTADSMNLAVTSNDPATIDLFNTNGIEDINLTVDGNNWLGITDPALESITIDGGGNLLLDGAILGAAQPSLIDGSAMTGSLTNVRTNPGFGIEVIGGSNNDTLFGTNDNDTLTGNAGDDDLFGGAGNDRITGGTGEDELTGGLNSDTFYFAAGDSSIIQSDADTIKDFVSGTDFIDLSPAGPGNIIISAVTNSYGDALASADAVLGGVINYFWQASSNGFDSYLFIDNNGDGDADEAIILQSCTTFVAGDII